jgi:hypothetical protein
VGSVLGKIIGRTGYVSWVFAVVNVLLIVLCVSVFVYLEVSL